MPLNYAPWRIEPGDRMARRAEVVEAVRNVPLFARCTKRDLTAIARHADLIEADADTVIVTEGDDGDAFYVIVTGAAVVRRGGRKRGELGPGDFFGELALLDPAPRSATVTTAEPTVLAVLGRRMFRVLVRELPAMNERLLAALAAQLREAGADT